MDPSSKTCRFVEGEEDGDDLKSDLGKGSCEIEEEIDVIGSQKNRERFAIKKTYSVEVNCSFLSFLGTPNYLFVK